MDPQSATGATGASGASVRPLTVAQQQALNKLHQASQQMESLFVGMLFKEMRKSAPTTSLTGKVSNAEETFEGMLDEKRAEELAKTGSLGIGKILEQQLRGAVLADPAAAASARVKQESEQ